MNRTFTRSLRRLAPLSAALLISAPLMAGPMAYGSYAGGGYGTGGDWRASDIDADVDGYDTAQVLRSEPLMHSVRIVEPRQECRTEVRYVPVRGRRGPDTGPATLVGGVLGAVIGHQIGHREARSVGTVAGALLGGAIGHEMAQQQGRRAAESGYRDDEMRSVEGEQCVTRAVERFEDRIDGYRVTYRYNGRVYSTQLPRDPGATLRVRVNVQPVG